MPSIEISPASRAATDEPSRSFYLAYLNSPTWRARRNAALRAADFRCSRCPSKRDLEVHHRSYKRLGAEWAEDLEVVCTTCHRAETLANPTPSLGVYLKLVSAIVTKTPFACVADVADEVKRQCVQLHLVQDLERITSAINVVCGTRLKTMPTTRTSLVDYAVDRPLSRQEAREFLCRFDVLRTLIRRWPEPPRRTTRKIDIDGPVEDWSSVDHDRY